MVAKYCPKCDMLVIVEKEDVICPTCGEQLQGDINE